MAKKATVKKPLFGNLRSHALNAVKHQQKLNLQKVKLEDGSTVKLTAREIRSLKKESK